MAIFNNNRLAQSLANAGLMMMPQAFNQLQTQVAPVRKRTVTRGTTSTIVTGKRKRATNKNSFAAKLMKAQPAKHYANSSTFNMTHNTLYTVVPTTGIVQGDTNAQRDGDFIHLAALKIKGAFISDTADGAYTYRILVGYTGEEYNLPTVFGSGLGSTELFITNTPAASVTFGIVNPKAFTVIYDQSLDINSLTATGSDLASFSFTCPLDKKFPYQADGSVFGKSQNLAIVVMAFKSGGVTGTTAAGGISLSYDLIFKPL